LAGDEVFDAVNRRGVTKPAGPHCRFCALTQQPGWGNKADEGARQKAEVSQPLEQQPGGVLLTQVIKFAFTGRVKPCCPTIPERFPRPPIPQVMVAVQDGFVSLQDPGGEPSLKAGCLGHRGAPVMVGDDQQGGNPHAGFSQVLQHLLAVRLRQG
jgi:hypothetical protein